MKKIVLIALALLLSACNTVQVKVPQALDQQGLLVGRIAAGVWSERNELTPQMTLRAGEGQAKLYQNGIKDNTITIALAPGEYTMNKVQHTGKSYGNVIVTSSFPVGRKFTIKAGQVTNLGLMVLVPYLQDKTKFIFHTLDNTADMQEHVKNTHPALYASLPDKNFTISEDGYADRPVKVIGLDKLDEVRKQIAYGKLIFDTPYAVQHVTGAAGTIAKIIYDSNKKISDIKILPTNTLEDMDDCSTYGKTVLCSVEPDREKGVFSGKWNNSGKYILVRDEKLERGQFQQKPAGHALWLVSESGIVIADEHLNIFTSYDYGANWTSYSGAAQKQAINQGIFGNYVIGYQAGKNGFYLYPHNRNVGNRKIVYTPHNKAEYRNIDFPNDLDQMDTLTESLDTLFAGSAHGILSGVAMYKKVSDAPWEKIGTLPYGCRYPRIESKDNISLKAHCITGDNIASSNDAGKTWAMTKK